MYAMSFTQRPQQAQLELLEIKLGLLENWELSTLEPFGSTILNNQIHFLVGDNRNKKQQQDKEEQKSPAPMGEQQLLVERQQKQQPQTSLMVKLNLQTGAYQKVQTQGDAPSVRMGPLVEALNNMYIVVYGGEIIKKKSDKSGEIRENHQNDPQVIRNNEELLDDAYALVFNEWKRLKVINPPVDKRCKFAFTTCGDKIYLHGGESVKDNQRHYHSELYQLSFSDTKNQLTFQLINPSPSSVSFPVGRSGHKMTSIGSRYLMIFGGETFDNQSSQNPTSFAGKTIDDVWVFDLVQLKWQSLDLKGKEKINSLKLQSMVSHQSQVYMLGDFQFLNSKRRVNLIMLEFPSLDTKETQPQLKSHHSIQRKSHPDGLLEGQGIQFATSLIHTASYSIRSPFQAIQRIVQFIKSQNSKTIRIHSEMTLNTIEKYIYVAFDFDHDDSLVNPSIGVESQVQKLFVYCLRLGKTVLYVKNNQKRQQTRVYLISADGRFSPLVERMQYYYAYSQTHNSFEHNSFQNIRNKTTIHKILQTLIPDPASTIRSIKGSKIIIFSPNIIPTPKSYFYQLVFDSPFDISVFKNNKKLEFLDRIKYDISNSMEFSLHSYLKYSNAFRSIDDDKQERAKIILSNSLEPIPQNLSYASYLEEFCKKDKLIKLTFPTDSLKNVKTYELYACQQDFYLPENNGILLYQSGKLVNRYECQFGQLLQEKFYPRQFHKDTKNVFKVVGEIHLCEQLKLTNFDTQFQKTNKFAQFQISLEKAIAEMLQELKPQLSAHHRREEKDEMNQQAKVSQQSVGHQYRQHFSVQPLQIKRPMGIDNSGGNNSSSENDQQDRKKRIKLDENAKNPPSD